ncbi:threonine--tRNA ligase [Firmicutes bacterium CAG:822]|nr:threonine--tRNA ligase [Firmicutes bacterium CAG:822]
MVDIKEDERLSVLNHSCAHLMAQAVKHLYPNAKFWVGPVISEGFYYDIDLGDHTLTDEDLEKISKEMKKIAKDGKRIYREEISREDALEKFKDDPYKIDIINELPEDAVISCYTQGDFTDLCRGPHVDSVKECKNFKLLKVSGAYYKGDSNNKVLQRIYGVCFDTKEDLEKHLAALEDAKERDHRKIGKELDLFMGHELVGPGLQMWLPNGAIIRYELEKYIKEKEVKLGYNHVYTPYLASTELYKVSGHWDHYKDDMFPPMKMDNEELVLRPMNCPHHMLIYKHKLHSYRDLPIRIGELAPDFRYEASGAVCGLERVRQMCQNDAHLFVRPDQIKEEVSNVVNLILEVYKDFNITDYAFRLSLRDKNNTEKYFDDDEMWEKAESELRKVLTELGIDFYEAEGEAAFYGPKLDVQIKSAIGHDVTLSTCQLDFLLPERFDLTYIDENGQKARPVVIHRAILGTFDRFMAFLIEETKGAFPLWLSPVQVNIIPVNNEYHLKYAKKVMKQLSDKNIRVKFDDRDEKLSYKMRESQSHKIPYTVIIGDKEKDNKTVSYRLFGHKETENLSLKEFEKVLLEQIKERR